MRKQKNNATDNRTAVVTIGRYDDSYQSMVSGRVETCHGKFTVRMGEKTAILTGGDYRDGEYRYFCKQWAYRLASYMKEEGARSYTLVNGQGLKEIPADGERIIRETLDKRLKRKR